MTLVGSCQRSTSILIHGRLDEGDISRLSAEVAMSFRRVVIPVRSARGLYLRVAGMVPFLVPQSTSAEAQKMALWGPTSSCLRRGGHVQQFCGPSARPWPLGQ